MKSSLILALCSLVPGAALADTLTGTIQDPALRRKTELVYVEKVPGAFPPPADPVVVNQRNNVYVPRLVPLLAGTKVSFRSEDKELHNVFARQGLKVAFNQAQPAGQKFEKSFNDPGIVHLTCNIHKEMSAWVLVLQNPFFARPDPKTGAFTITGLPAGTYTVRIWGEKLPDEALAKKFTVTVGGAEPAPVTLAVR